MKRATSILGAATLTLALSAGISSSAGASAHHRARVTANCKRAIQGYQLEEGLLAQVLDATAGYASEIGPAAQAGEDESPTELTIVTDAIDSLNTKVSTLRGELDEVIPGVKSSSAACLAGR